MRINGRVINILILALLIIMSGCTSVMTPIPSTITPSTISQTNTPEKTATLAESPIPSSTPTQLRLMTIATDEQGDGMHAPGEKTYLPDYMDFIDATFLVMESGGLQISVNTAAPIPEDFEGENNGFYLFIYFNEPTDTHTREDAWFYVLSTRNPYSDSPDFTVDISDQTIVFNLGLQTIKNWPDTIFVRLESNYMPPGIKTGNVDGFPDSLLETIPIQIR